VLLIIIIYILINFIAEEGKFSKRIYKVSNSSRTYLRNIQTIITRRPITHGASLVHSSGREKRPSSLTNE
jgi:hypothetical protein